MFVSNPKHYIPPVLDIKFILKDFHRIEKCFKMERLVP